MLKREDLKVGLVVRSADMCGKRDEFARRHDRRVTAITTNARGLGVVESVRRGSGPVQFNGVPGQCYLRTFLTSAGRVIEDGPVAIPTSAKTVKARVNDRQPMTPEQRAAEDARDVEAIDAATAGPWRQVPDPKGTRFDIETVRLRQRTFKNGNPKGEPVASVICFGGLMGACELANAEFIARARTRWPAAIAERDAAQAEVADLRAECESSATEVQRVLAGKRELYDAIAAAHVIHLRGVVGRLLSAVEAVRNANAAVKVAAGDGTLLDDEPTRNRYRSAMEHLFHVAAQERDLFGLERFKDNDGEPPF